MFFQTRPEKKFFYGEMALLFPERHCGDVVPEMREANFLGKKEENSVRVVKQKAATCRYIASYLSGSEYQFFGILPR